MGSALLWGRAACPPLPWISILNSLLEAIIGPLVTPKCPSPNPGQLCMPKTASQGNCSKRPSSIIFCAPAPPSSAGWKIKIMLPLNSRWLDRYCAAPRSMAVWPSWPQACIFPGLVEACAKVFFSCKGSASMSARRPIIFPVPSSPSIRPTTPVLPKPLNTGIPQLESASATNSAVRFSSKRNSGWAWILRRICVIVSVDSRISGLS